MYSNRRVIVFVSLTAPFIIFFTVSQYLRTIYLQNYTPVYIVSASLVQFSISCIFIPYVPLSDIVLLN